MAEPKENEIVIKKDDGSEQTLSILFFYENPERKKTFYFLYKEETPEDVLVLTSVDGVSMEYPNEEELEEAEEMLDTYENDPKIAEARK